MGTLVSTETGGSAATQRIEKTKLIVVQPQPITALVKLLDSIDTLAKNVSEMQNEDASSDMGFAGTVARGSGSAKSISPRDRAIANLPVAAVMQTQLEKHIRFEVKKLNKEARKAAHSSRPGAAFYVNELYARIRRLHALLHELLEASVETVKRLFVRVFVDKQQII